MLLKDRVVVVTGGAGLIGQEFIGAITKQGGYAIIADIDDKGGEIIKNHTNQEFNSSQVDFIELDITNKKSIQECIVSINKKYQRIDALVNNAYPRNKNYGRHFFNVEYDDFVENLGLNLGGCILPSQLFAKYFQKQGYGNIVNISSIYGVMAPRFEIYDDTEMTVPLEYAAIKSGLLHLTKYMAKYFKGMNIRVNAISPGGILDSQPKEFLEKYNQLCSTKGMLSKEDLNETLIFLLSDMSMYINGQNIVVDDGFSL